MPPRLRTNHASTVFFGVRFQPEGHFAAEISVAGVRVWLGTFSTREEAAPLMATTPCVPTHWDSKCKVL
ncbi:hypothetical protein QYE76_050248 [Lolium multiflorum]|uniref:AP2/ERF domain-containing protein n=1 Tax=Lolium multiflorum TaxID=4521 RepID=A0AAD8SQJ2_LOLMU|nr:hypothetical protein QYE76_050248 [Lolium multiflorum]